MRTHELADHAAVNPQTLRYYERRGLLPQPPRSPAGYRDYPAAAVRVIGFIKRAQQLGFTLDQIGELLDLALGGPDSADTTRTLAEHHIADLTARIADLDRMREALHQLTATSAQPTRDCPLLDAIPADPAQAP